MKARRRLVFSGAFVLSTAATAGACSPSGGNEVTPKIEAGIDSAPATSDAADAARPSDAPADVLADVREEDAKPPVLERVSGHVDYMGSVTGAKVTLLAPPSHAGLTTTTDSNGDFFVYVPLGSSAIFKVEASNLLPMIRGVVVAETNRIRNYYLAGQPEKDAAQALGLSIDPTKGIVEVDFRNAAVGGYAVTLKNGAAASVPGFGIALQGDGTPVQSMSTVTGGAGSTLLLGNVAVGTLSFTPDVPAAAGKACKPCDAPNLPVHAGAVTWFDFECGDATDCQ